MKILFVCLGNICRSPLAEGLFRKLVKEAGLERSFEIDSAGTSSYHIGERPHSSILRLGEQYNISFDGIAARQVSRQDFYDFDVLIAMDRSNFEDLLRIAPELDGKLRLFLSFTDSPEKDVHDPYFDGDFPRTYEQVEKGCRGLLAHLARPT